MGISSSEYIPQATPTPTPVPKSPEQVAYEKALEEFKAVEAAAKSEGKLVLYTTGSAGELGPRLAVFQRLYPEITVEAMKLASAVREERAKAEAATGKGIGDVLESGQRSAEQIARAGIGLAFEPPAVLEPGVTWAALPTSRSPEGEMLTSLAYGLGQFTFVYNTKLLTATSTPPLPKSILELTQPEWKGKFNWHDPRTGGPGRHVFAVMYLTEGPEVTKKLMANSVLLNDYTEENRSVARGDYLLTLVTSAGGAARVVIEEGTPVAFGVFTEGTVPQFVNVVILKAAPHPNAAKLWVNYLLTSEGQKATADSWTMPLRVGIPVPLPILEPTVKRMPYTPLSPEFEAKWEQTMLDFAKAMAKELGK